MRTEALEQLLGKTLSVIMVNESDRQPEQTQLFLVCADGTVVEIYGQIMVAKTVMHHGEASVTEYLESSRMGDSITRIAVT